MKFFLLFACLSYSWILFAQEIDILITETPPYEVAQDINVEVYLTNTTNKALTYFDSRGPSWDSFKEVWDLRANSKYIEILPLNGAYHHKFPDSIIITLQPSEKKLIRSHSINLISSGLYSLTYTQEQASKFVKKEFADSSVSDSAVLKITAFQVSKNITFEVFSVYDTTISEIINMPWEDWKDYRHAKLYSREKHFDNMYAALRYPQDVYALTLFCNGLDEASIRSIGRLKNLRALVLRNYELDFFPKEIAELDLYELTLVPKNEMVVNFSEGLSENNTLRELRAKFYAGIPKQILEQKDLIYLDISDCPIKTLPKLDSLKKLEVLIANNTDIVTLSNTNLDHLLKLKELNLSGNKEIEDLGPILNCTNLEFLVINRTSIQCIPHEIENLKKLKKLSISNALTSVSDSIGNLSDMRYLSLGGNRNLSQIPHSIVKMKKLLHLDVSSTKIEQLPEGIAELPLEKVLIYNTNCKITKDYKLLKKHLGSKFKN